MNETFCVPEKERRFYFLENLKYKDPENPIQVQDFTLWAQISSLDTITSPSNLIVTKSRGSYCYMYQVELESEPPDDFSVIDQSGMKIFYTPTDKFLQSQASNPCVPIPENNWEECSLRFHALAAFYRLNVIPSLSLSLFEREDLFDSMCEQFCKKYRVSDYAVSLPEIFEKTLFALEFLDFASSNLDEERSLNAAKEFVKEYKQYGKCRGFAFTEIKNAISNYHKKCFPNRYKETGIPNDVLDCVSYYNLMNTIQFVRRSLVSLNLLSDEPLLNDVRRFQHKYLVNEPSKGYCNTFTLRHLWNASMKNECDFLVLCRLCGMNIKNPLSPLYTKTLQKIDINDPQLNTIENIVNQILDSIKDKSEASQWMIDEAQKSAKVQIKRIDKAATTTREIDRAVCNIEEKLEQACKQNEESATKFNDTSKLLNEIIDEHLAMRKEFSVIAKRIYKIRNGNRLLLIFVLILGMYVIYHLFADRNIKI